MSSSSSSASEPFIPKHDKVEYSEARTSDEEDPNVFLSRSRTRVLSWITKAIILALALHSLITLVISVRIHFRKAAIPPCQCGSTITEAKAQGCRFDSLATSWLPPHCRDDEVSALFEKAGPGPNGEWYYHGSNDSSSQTFTVGELASMADRPDVQDRRVWTTVDWHNSHCFYTLLKEIRGKVRLEYTGFPTGLAHAEHCAETMTEFKKGDQIIVSIAPGLGDPTPDELAVMD
ncbi:hypothetical protein F5B20DRAFT_536495 [Whalleya microplaca]|nr:hypothetical protein F5B20DRAFT_536495 [Whalleya microplaca]